MCMYIDITCIYIYTYTHTHNVCIYIHIQGFTKNKYCTVGCIMSCDDIELLNMIPRMI